MVNKKYCFIYKTTNLVNSKIYIGLHTTNNLNDGYIGCGVYGWCGDIKTSYFHSAVRKYGYENFKLEILENCIPCINYLNEREKYYIKLYNSTDKSIGYNLSEGGGCRQNIIVSYETRNKISNSHLGKKKSQSHAKNISIGQRNLAKDVFAYKTNGKFIGRFGSIIETSEILNLNRNAVSNAMHKKIRYRDFVFFREEKIFDKYIANKSFHRRVFVFNESFIIIDQSNSIIELAEKYKINYNCLNSRCNRFSIINGLYFIKETKIEEFKKLKNILQ